MKPNKMIQVDQPRLFYIQSVNSTAAKPVLCVFCSNCFHTTSVHGLLSSIAGEISSRGYFEMPCCSAKVTDFRTDLISHHHGESSQFEKKTLFIHDNHVEEVTSQYSLICHKGSEKFYPILKLSMTNRYDMYKGNLRILSYDRHVQSKKQIKSHGKKRRHILNLVYEMLEGLGGKHDRGLMEFAKLCGPDAIEALEHGRMNFWIHQSIPILSSKKYTQAYTERASDYKRILKDIRRKCRNAASMTELVTKLAVYPKRVKPAVIKEISGSAMNGEYNALAAFRILEPHIKNHDVLLNCVKMARGSIDFQRAIPALSYKYVRFAVKALGPSFQKLFADICDGDNNWMFKGDVISPVQEQLHDTLVTMLTLAEKKGKDFIFTELAKEKFRPTVKGLHDVVTDIYDKVSTPEIIFQYKPEILEMQGKYAGYSWLLPRNNHELSKWGKWMHNCVGSYADRVKANSAIIFGVFKGDKMYVCVEINPNLGHDYSRDVPEAEATFCVPDPVLHASFIYRISQYKAFGNTIALEPELVQSRLDFVKARQDKVLEFHEAPQLCQTL